MRSLMGDQESRDLFAAESRTRAMPSNFLLSVRPLQRKVEFSTDLDPEAGQRTSVSAVMERLSLSSSFATRMSDPCSPKDRTFHVPRRKFFRRSTDGPWSFPLSGRFRFLRDFFARVFAGLPNVRHNGDPATTTGCEPDAAC